MISRLFRFEHGGPRESSPSPSHVSSVLSVVYATKNRGNTSCKHDRPDAKADFRYKGKSADIRQVARDLGVWYMPEGGVRKGGERLRITAQALCEKLAFLKDKLKRPPWLH
jgi:hypothetical protein